PRQTIASPGQAMPPPGQTMHPPFQTMDTPDQTMRLPIQTMTSPDQTMHSKTATYVEMAKKTLRTLARVQQSAKTAKLPFPSNGASACGGFGAWAANPSPL